MTTTATYQSINALREWATMIAKGGKSKVIVTPASMTEALCLLDKAMGLPAWLGGKGIGCRVSASSDIQKKGFKVTANGCEFQVNPVPDKTMKRGVTETSRAAYHALDVQEAALPVIRYAIEATKKHGGCTDKLVSQALGKDAGFVSARRDWMIKNEVFRVDGKEYRFESTSKGPCPITGNTVQWWRVIPCETEQLNLFQ